MPISKIKFANFLAFVLLTGLSYGPKLLAADDLAPLMQAVATKNYGWTEELLELEFDPNIQGPHGTTPLHEAVANRDLGISCLLLMAGANTLALDGQGLSPLQMALENEDKRMARLFVESEHLRSLWRFGEQPLHVFIGWNDFETAEKLLHRGADPFESNNGGRMPVEMNGRLMTIHPSARVRQGAVWMHFRIMEYLRKRKGPPLPPATVYYMASPDGSADELSSFSDSGSASDSSSDDSDRSFIVHDLSRVDPDPDWERSPPASGYASFDEDAGENAEESQS